ncbi:MAG: ABC transporter substrate-binding protein, partial [Cyanobacteriota bacterium]
MRRRRGSPGGGHLRQQARLLAFLLALAALTAACAAPHPGTSLIVASKSRIDSLDPVQASRSGQMQVLSALGDPLY